MIANDEYLRSNKLLIPKNGDNRTFEPNAGSRLSEKSPMPLLNLLNTKSEYG